jgi:hypothetical protein
MKSPIEIPDEVRTSLLVAMLYEKEAAIAALQEERDDLQQNLIDRGKGVYTDANGRTATVVIPVGSESIDLYPKPALDELLKEMGLQKATPEIQRSFRKSRESQARALAGDSFLDLFDCVTAYIPRPSFADRADALLTPARKRRPRRVCAP